MGTVPVGSPESNGEAAGCRALLDIGNGDRLCRCMSQSSQLTQVRAGMEIVYGGDRVLRVPAAVAERFAPGDALMVVAATGELLHVPAAERAVADRAVTAAEQAFRRMGGVRDDAISALYEGVAARVAD